MSNIQLISAVLGSILGGCIVWLVRRDFLNSRYAIRWMLIAVLVVLLGFNPQLIDDVGHTLGVGYPPIIALLIAIGALLVKILLMDIERTHNQILVERLTQRVAILEAKIDHTAKNNKQFDRP